MLVFGTDYYIISNNNNSNKRKNRLGDVVRVLLLRNRNLTIKKPIKTNFHTKFIFILIY
jgi:hypothetical protein